MDEVVKKFAELAEKFGPSVVDAVLGAARVKALSTLVAGLTCLVTAAVFARAGAYFWRNPEMFEDGGRIVGFVCCVIAATLGFIGAFSVIDPWTWAGLTHPDLWIAKRVFRL